MYKYILILVLTLSGFYCKKEKVMNSANEKLFEETILNSDFVVSYANDHGTILTSNYSGYVFVLLKTDNYHGPLKVSKNGQVYEGSWSAGEDYGKLTISLPSTSEEFKFLSRAWRFTSKKLPVLKLAPWGEGDGIAVNMTRQ